MKNFVLVFGLLSAFGLQGSKAHAQSQPRKLAFLVGVSKYDKAPLVDLKYPESDTAAIAAELKKDGFEVQTLLGASAGTQRATIANLKSQLLGRFIKSLGNLKKPDIALVVLSGHGLQAEVTTPTGRIEEAYYCPVDGLANNTETLLSIGELMDSIVSGSGANYNLLVIDACRDNNGKGTKGVDGTTVKIAKANLGILFAASSGSSAYESEKLHAGLMAHYLLEGLKGSARDNSGDVTWDGLVTYVRNKVTNESVNLVGEQQFPHAIASLQGSAPIFCHLAEAAALIKPPLLQVPFEKQQAEDAAMGWAKYYGLRPEFTNKIGMQMKLIPPGEFTMGNSISAGADDTPHPVRITKPFYVDIHETTLGEFKAFVKDASYKTTIERIKDTARRGWIKSANKFGQSPSGFNWKNTGWEQSDDHPVVNVSWYDADTFVRWLSKKEGKHYRLLTEAEWEYCCRAGTATLYQTGDDPNDLVKVGNVLDDTGWKLFKRDPQFATANQDLVIHREDGFAFTAPVGKYRANAFGLHDMHGNVCEWCSDYYAPNYESYDRDDPTGANNSKERSARGGRFDTGEDLAKSSFRNHGDPNTSDMILGIRVAAEY